MFIFFIEFHLSSRYMINLTIKR